MEIQKSRLIGLAVIAALAQTSMSAEIRPEPPVDALANAQPDMPAATKKPPHRDSVYTPPPASVEESAATEHTIASGLGANGVFSAAAVPMSTSTTLSPPVTINASGTTPALSINETGTGKGLQSLLTSSGNASSAIYGQSVGGGAGIAGYNFGTVGFAGKFVLNNAKAAQPSISASTSGVGPAVSAATTNQSNLAPLIVATTINGTGVQGTTTGGIGVQGHSSTHIGVLGESASGYGLVGETTSSGTGVYGDSPSGSGVYGTSTSGAGVQGSSVLYYGVNGTTESGLAAINADNYGGGRGIVSHSASGIGVYASSDTNTGVWGQSNNSFGVVGVDTGSGIGVWGQSVTGYAGFFQGKVGATQYITASDRNLKTNFKQIDGASILKRVTALPITTWDFKSDSGTHHLGPMAQDFHAAFGLNGNDDKNINLTDIAGVSLAAIQELSRQITELRNKDAEIAQLKAQLQSVTEALSTRLTNLEHPLAPDTRTAALDTQRTLRERPNE